MKTMKILSVALLIGVAAISCQKQPEAQISASKTTVEVNESVSFSNTTLDANTYEWNFGDGGTSTNRTPSHSWSTAGSFFVEMTAFSKNKKKKDAASITITVTVKDPCINITCLNGGTCANGICNCPPGYSGTNCETYNPCYNITCLNGGYCANGQCVCSQGYTGVNCSQQITPIKITITKIQVTRFPATDGGGGWDFTSGPDIFPKILLVSTVIWDSPTYYTDANPSSIYDFNPSPYINLTSPTSQYTIELYDYDTADPNDWMGGIYFTPYNSSNGFPSILTIDAGGSVAFKLYVTYTW